MHLLRLDGVLAHALHPSRAFQELRNLGSLRGEEKKKKGGKIGAAIG